MTKSLIQCAPTTCRRAKRGGVTLLRNKEDNMEITKTINESEATLSVEGWLDTQAAPQMKEALDGLESDITSLILDFKGLEYISSSGIREVVSAYKKMDGAVVVKNVSPGIMSTFKATGLDKKIRFE